MFDAIIRACFIIMGSFALAIAVKMQRKRTLLKKAGLVTEGVIIKMEKDDDPESTNQYPVVRYITFDEQVIILRHDVGRNPPAYHTGQQVQILYDPTAPEKFVIGSGKIAWDVLEFAVVGSAFIIGGIAWSLWM